MSIAPEICRMTAVERLDQVAGLLATGLHRQKMRKQPKNVSKSSALIDKALDFGADESVHIEVSCNPENRYAR